MQATLRFRAGVLYDQEGRDGEAVASLTTAMELFQQVGDRTGEARAVNSLGVVARGRGELDRARSYLQASLALRDELGWGISTTLNNLGLVAMDAGDQDAARDHSSASSSSTKRRVTGTASPPLGATWPLWR